MISNSCTIQFFPRSVQTQTNKTGNPLVDWALLAVYHSVNTVNYCIIIYNIHIRSPRAQSPSCSPILQALTQSHWMKFHIFRLNLSDRSGWGRKMRVNFNGERKHSMRSSIPGQRRWSPAEIGIRTLEHPYCERGRGILSKRLSYQSARRLTILLLEHFPPMKQREFWT